ncbi:synaptotagmin-C-like isoform X2 [Coregonus clupeaformis]|uniref:synaptotagmin-C-like isoform X2 n=1 Tax=Coregonus clupeaformis TaxID=59861 RepID=UPI001E1C9255|nr:synaptotagmin-C-like isoform X2 [Coregonus clupeaformis]
MSGDWDEDHLCKKALTLVEELCLHSSAKDSHEASCRDFVYMMRGQQHETEISVSLLSVIVTFCGIVLLSVSLFVSWKLCWLPWRDKEGGGLSLTSGLMPGGVGGMGGSGGASLLPPVMQRKASHSSLYPSLAQPQQHHPHFSDLLGVESGQGVGGVVGGPEQTQEHSYLDMDSYPNNAGNLKLSQTSPELPPTTEGGAAPPHKDLPNAHSQQQVTARTEQLVVKILKAVDLAAKDANGFSDPYVKIYLLPDRKKKFQTKVHRKTLNPIFNETFQFGVPLAELHSRKLHFSVYDFDRFSRHDLIGQVVVDNLLDFSEGTGEKPVWRDIVEGTAEKADLGELNFSLCYLPTAGRLTATVIKATNLKAMDLTGFSDPYVKASLICDSRRLKKKKTSIKKNTLNPTYNEALVFDIPHEDIDRVSIVIAVMDYDCIGHNEVIGMCRVGSDAEGPGREHWTAMLANPRKPIDHWHQLVEEKLVASFVSKSPAASPKPHIVVDSPHSE